MQDVSALDGQTEHWVESETDTVPAGWIAKSLTSFPYLRMTPALLSSQAGVVQIKGANRCRRCKVSYAWEEIGTAVGF